MFRNIGKKIMVLATVICIIGIVASFLSAASAVLTLKERSDNLVILIIAAVIVALIGSLFSWLGSFTLYGFGKLIDNSDKLVKNSEKLLATQKEQPVALPQSQKQVEEIPAETSGNLSWTCEKCGAAVSEDYDHCPLCEYVAKAEGKSISNMQ